MAVDAGGVAIVVQDSRLGSVVGIASLREDVTFLRELRKDVRNRGGDVRIAVVANHAILRVGIQSALLRDRAAQQSWTRQCVVLDVAGTARVLGDGRVTSHGGR